MKFEEVLPALQAGKSFALYLKQPLTGTPVSTATFTGAVEIKCPKTKTHIKYIRMGKIPNEYKEQVWAYFMVNPDLQWVDFVSYDPRLTKKPIWILHITREEVAEDLETATAELNKFITKLNKYRNEIFF